VWERASEEVAKGHRVFVVCPRIGDGDDGGDLDVEESPLSSVTELAERLQAAELSHLRVGTLHGRMSPEEKDDIMRRFAEVSATDGIDVLVSTTVIEVGVDVPDATLMVIMDADRFGISQLHQMRGRVGRGGLPGLCLLVTAAENGSPARERLAAVASTIDGFELSQLDLELRREGDVLGAIQSGRRSSLRLLEVLRDEDVIARARADADAVIRDDPTLVGHPALRHALARLTAEQSTDYLEKA
jgi:ATP-dependent DNA helicase RecG